MKRFFLILAVVVTTPVVSAVFKNVSPYVISEAQAYREGDPRLDRWLGVRTRVVRWCGVYLAKIVKSPPRGYASVDAWKRWGKRVTCRPGAVAVFRHRHVGLVTATRKGHIRVKSGNDGNAIKDRWRRASTIRECRSK